MSKKHTLRQVDRVCPCGNGPFMTCCGRYLQGGELPETAEALMRSRYSAYALKDEKYLRNSWYISTRPEGEILASLNGVKWTALDIASAKSEGNEGIVDFTAHYKVQGRARNLHEVARFVKDDGRWFYFDGTFPED